MVDRWARSLTVDSQIKSADEALSLIQDRVAHGLTPVMRGTSFYRHNFSASQFGSYIWYLDERGTRGCCQFQNVPDVFDFVDLGRPVPGNLPDAQELRVAPMTVVVEVVRQRHAPSLLEAAEAALGALEAAGVGGAVVADLVAAIAVERVRRPL